MKKLFLSLLALLLLMGSMANGEISKDIPCFSGEPDYVYQDDKLHIQIKRVQESGITYFVSDIRVADPGVLKTALTGKGEATVSALAIKNQAVFAINGDDYGVHKYGTIIRQGELLRANNTTRHMLAIDSQGDFSIRTDRSGENPKQLAEELLANGVVNTLEFGPELVRGGQAVSLKTKFDVISVRDTQLEPRTAIGQLGPLHYIVMIVDGRNPGYSDGISLKDLQQLMLRYGAVTAINLDGGGSTTLYFQGTVINQPSGGRERTVTDIIYFK